MNAPELKSFVSYHTEPIALTAPLMLKDIALIGLHSALTYFAFEYLREEYFHAAVELCDHGLIAS